MTKFRTPLSRVRLWGSAKDGTKSFTSQRLTAIALIPLSLWFVVAVIFFIARADHASLITWMQTTFHAEMLILLILAMIYHAYIGMHEVFADYVHHEVTKVIVMISLNFFAIFITIASILAVLRIALGG